MKRLFTINTKNKKEEYLSNINFTKREKTIFELGILGLKIEEIANIVNVSKRTIDYDIEDIKKKISNYENKKEKELSYVYIHIFPNGKKYVGTTKNCRIRWNNGKGYKLNEEMYNDILKYGWDNIKHIILLKTIDDFSAINLERKLINAFNLKNSDFGYNKK